MIMAAEAVAIVAAVDIGRMGVEQTGRRILVSRLPQGSVDAVAVGIPTSSALWLMILLLLLVLQLLLLLLQ